MIKGVFFDFFGTLVLPYKPDLKWSEWYSSMYPFYEKNGINISEESFRSICKNFWIDVYKENNPGFTLFENRLLSQARLHGIDPGPERIRSLADDVSEAWFNEHYLDHEAEYTLKHFKRSMRTALITNFDHPPQIRTMLVRYNIANLFDSVIISGDVGVKKPMPEIFDPALSETSLSAHEVVYIGDSIMDFRAALHAGIPPIIIRREGQHDPSTPGSSEAMYEKTDVLMHELALSGQIDIISKLSDIKLVLNKYL